MNWHLNVAMKFKIYIHQTEHWITSLQRVNLNQAHEIPAVYYTAVKSTVYNTDAYSLKAFKCKYHLGHRCRPAIGLCLRLPPFQKNYFWTVPPTQTTWHLLLTLIETIHRSRTIDIWQKMNQLRAVNGCCEKTFCDKEIRHTVLAQHCFSFALLMRYPTPAY